MHSGENNSCIFKSGRRCRSLFSSVNSSYLGNKTIVKECGDDRFSTIRVIDPLGTKISWIEPPQSVLLLRKNDDTLVNNFLSILSFLINKNLLVYIESNDSILKLLPQSDKRRERIVKVNRNEVINRDFCDEIDFVICIGGDGTLIRASSFFPRSCPPVVPFNSGSVGFLNPFSFEQYENAINKVLEGNIPVLIRERLECRIISSKNQSNISTSLAFNEIVIDRGSHPYITNIDLFLNDKYITKVQGDGLIISTPTGSTAYAMAAGASMVHPNVDAIVICPICPHSLSFRPIVVPQKVKLKLIISESSRNSAYISIDGHFIREVEPSASIEIITSYNPVPCICAKDQIADWFESLAHCLHWNMRVAQKPLSNSSEYEDENEKSVSNGSEYEDANEKSESIKNEFENANENPVLITKEYECANEKPNLN